MIICFILIVAECNVNGGQQFLAGQEMLILIVAECNVNQIINGVEIKWN